MNDSFTIARAHVEAVDPTSLRAEIVRETGCESEAESILRSLERMGMDPSIEYYEMTSVMGRRVHGGGPVTRTWRVRADRGLTAEDNGAG